MRNRIILNFSKIDRYGEQRGVELFNDRRINMNLFLKTLLTTTAYDLFIFHVCGNKDLMIKWFDV